MREDGHWAIISALTAIATTHCADMNRTNKKDGDSALHKAVKGGNPYCVTSLLGTVQPNGNQIDLSIKNLKARPSLCRVKLLCYGAPGSLKGLPRCEKAAARTRL